MTRRTGFRIALFENVRFALGAMRSQKLRSFLTLLGVMAGVATVIMMVSFVVGFNNQVTASFTAFGAQLVQFQKYEPRFGGPDRPEEERNRRDLTYEDALALKRLAKHVAAVSAERYLFRDTVVKAGRNQANGPVVFGGIPDYCVANVHFVQDGRFISDSDVLHRAWRWGSDVADALARDAIDGAHDQRPGLPGHRDFRTGRLHGRRDQRPSSRSRSLVRRPVPGDKNGHDDDSHRDRPQDPPSTTLIEETAIIRARGVEGNRENKRHLHERRAAQAVQAITGGVAASWSSSGCSSWAASA